MFDVQILLRHIVNDVVFSRLLNFSTQIFSENRIFGILVKFWSVRFPHIFVIFQWMLVSLLVL